MLTTALVFLCNLGVLGLLYGQLRDDALARLRDQVAAQANDLEAAWRDDGRAGLTRAIADMRASGDAALVVAAYDGARAPFAQVGTVPVRVEPARFAIAALGGRMDDQARDTGYEVRRVDRDMLILSGRLIDDRQQMQHALERALLWSALLSILLGGAGALVIVVYVSRRLRVIAAAVDRVSAGDIRQRAAIVSGGTDAFDGLAQRVNMMLDRIERLLDELRLMTDGFAHDLRSPLARLRAKVERAAEEADAPAAVAAMDAALLETDLLMRMLTTLLQIGRAEALADQGDLERIVPSSILEELADLYEPLAQDAGVALSVTADADVPPMPLNRKMLSQALSNLIDNALRYGGTKIVLRLGVHETSDGRRIALAVEDNGPGIAPDQRSQALRRFGKLDSARSGPGAGLGLALVQAVARLHGGHLALEDNSPGLAALIFLPMRQ